MTIILAMKEKDGITLVADTQLSWPNAQASLAANLKMFFGDDYAIGFAGCMDDVGRAVAILKQHMTIGGDVQLWYTDVVGELKELIDHDKIPAMVIVHGDSVRDTNGGVYQESPLGFSMVGSGLSKVLCGTALGCSALTTARLVCALTAECGGTLYTVTVPYGYAGSYRDLVAVPNVSGLQPEDMVVNNNK